MLLSVACGMALFFPQGGAAQQLRGFAVGGYVTNLHPAGGFDVNGEQVVVGHATTFGLAGDSQAATDSPLRDAVRVGTYVFVSGEFHGKPKILTAETVRLRDDWDWKLAGMGVIDRVICEGPEPVFQADGYRIRITAATKMAFRGSLKTLADAGTNIWLRYEGVRDKNGVLVATEAEFIPAKPAKVKAIAGIEKFEMGPRAANAEQRKLQQPAPAEPIYLKADGSLNQDAEARLYQFGGWQRIPMDPPLQARVRRVGMSLVPAYQKQLPAGHPSRIDFRFYAVDAAKFHADVCSFEGLVLIPMQMVERLKSDDQLAAILADGVAYNLQRQGARLIGDSRAINGAQLASGIAGAVVPGFFAVTALGAAAAEARIEIQMEEQRGRVALALMADAGYDPRQAPEAWRLLAPRTLPADLSSLKYPNRSGYQLGILNLQYGQAGAGEDGRAATTSR